MLLKQSFSRASFALCFLLLSAVTSSASAEWKPYVSGREEFGTIEISGRNPITRSITFNSVDQAAKNAYAEIQTQLAETISQQLVGKPGYQSHSFAFSGPLNLTLTPALGSHAVTLGGFSASLVAKYSSGSGLTRVTCTAWIDIGPIKLTSGSFDSPTGKFYGLQFVGTPVGRHANCDNGLSWLPVIGWILDDFIDGKAEQALASAVAEALNKPIKVFEASTFMGLQETLSSGVFIDGSDDLGMYIKNNLQNLFLGAQVSVFVQDPSFVPKVEAEWDAYFQAVNPPPIQQTDRRFAISFSSPNATVSFSALRRYTYKATWVCPPRVKSCTPPL